MKFEESLEDAERAGQQTLALMAQHRIPANPINYSICYLYVTCRYPDLNEELDETLGTRGNLPPEKSQELYQAYFLNDSTQDSQRASASVQAVLSGLIQDLGSMASTNHKYGDALDDALEHMQGERDNLPKLLSSLVALTRETLASNEIFQGMLETATDDVERLQSDLEQTQREAMSDPLTGLMNRRAFDVSLEQVLSRGKPGAEVALLVIDIDHFKNFNDRYGHSIGDQVLSAVGTILRKNSPGDAVVARYGGEEFVVLLNDTNRAEVHRIAEGFRTALSRLRLRQKQTGKTIGQITISVGVALSAVEEVPETFFDDADSALYSAKQTGRDRVVFAESEAA